MTNQDTQPIKLFSIPPVDPIHGITVGEMYQLSLQMNVNLRSHMSKNSEWGAIGYLTHTSQHKLRQGNSCFFVCFIVRYRRRQ